MDGGEKMLVYEYMPQGPLSLHLFEWAVADLRPLEWKQWLSISLDVARGVEYLQNLARTSFIHRDLKPSNILLGDDMRAKVSDFELVKLAPDGKFSVETRLADTFGYLAPEYAVTHGITPFHSIALDVARGVEYLHSLAQTSFIHRDLKPSNILLGDDMRAKVSDFELFKLAPDGKFSIETRLARTFGYLAPEYAGTHGITPFHSIALDVTRGVEYLHSLAQTSFIHRDLKPSNILLGDDMRAKVSDCELVKLAPDGKFSVETRLADTFGYLGPEYAEYNEFIQPGRFFSLPG